jgi:hypothetical protein
MPRTLVVSTAVIALSTVAATGVMADSAGSLRAGGFHAGGRHAGGFHPGGVHAGGIPARGLAVGHPAGATPRHGFTATPFPGPAMAAHRMAAGLVRTMGGTEHWQDTGILGTASGILTATLGAWVRV